MSDITAVTQSHAWPKLGLRWTAVSTLLLILIALFLLSLTLGSVRIPLQQILVILLGGEADKATWATIVYAFRLPKAIMAVLAGAALSVSGLQMQTMFRNPLAGPFILGINSGASLGVALVVLTVGAAGTSLLAGLGLLGGFGVVIAASLGAGLVLLLVLLLSRYVDTMTLLILGLMFGYITGALVSLLLYFSNPERIQAYISWTFGSFGGVTWGQLQVMIPAVVGGMALAWLSAKSLNALLLGETYARSLGLNVQRAQVVIILSTAVLAGTITAFCGPIIFIGVAVPHLCRMMFHTADHRLLIPAAILMGAIVALLADLMAQVPGSQIVLPLNAVMALLGVPVVIWVILRRRNLRSSFAGG
ncbi:MAG: iron ABC transporter permease [Chloroflexi bacterium]|nr:iron ABC transporter permease [Chloroflexota bacterium]